MIGALIGGVFLSKQNQNTQKGAYFAGTKIMMMPSDIIGTVGDQVTAQLFVETDSGAKISSIDTQICYGSELSLDPSDSSKIELNKDVLGTLIDASVAGTDGNKCLRLIAIADLNKKAEDLQSGTLRIATIRFNAVATGSGDLRINRTTTKVGGYNPTEGATDSALQVGEIKDARYIISNPGTLTPTSVALNPIHWQTGNVDLTASDFYIEVISPSSGSTKYYSKNIDVNLNSDPGNRNYTTLEATWQENGKEMRLNMYLKANDNNWWSDEIRTYGATQNGWIYYYGTYFNTPIGGTYNDLAFNITGSSNESPAVTGHVYFKDLSLKTVFNGQISPTPTTGQNECSPAGKRMCAGTVSYKVCSNELKWGETILCPLGQICTGDGICSVLPTLTPTPIISNNGILKFKMTYLGTTAGALCAQPANMPMSVIVRSEEGSSSIYSNVIATKLSGNQGGLGIYEVTLPLDGLYLGDRFSVFVKDAKHLQVKYGVNNQSVFYNKAGGELGGLTNDFSTTPLFDITKYPLLAGDVTGPGGAQDGIVDGLDFSYVKTESIKRTAADAGGYMLADLNGNCKMESQDLSILMLSLSERQGQLY